MTRSKSLAPSILVPSIFLMHVVYGAQFLNATRVIIVKLSLIIVISLFTEM